MQITSSPCYICKNTNNPIIASEPVEHRFGRPLLPEGVYNFARCRKCSTLYVDSCVTDDYLSDIYRDETIEAVSEFSGVDNFHERMVALRLPEFKKHWTLIKKLRPPTHGDQLLDIGCQTGDFGSVAQRDGVQPNGIELSSDYVADCQSRWGGKARVHCGTVANAPFKNEQFQYITSFETLEHMCDPIETLQRLRIWLGKDGLLAISVPSSDYFHLKYWLLRGAPLNAVAKRLFERRSEFYKRQVLPHTHIYNFSCASVKLLLERAGFQEIFISLTGWHGRIGSLLSPIGAALKVVSRSRVALAPSLFVIARSTSE